MTNDDDKHWHLDRRIPIAVVVGLAVQLVLFFVYADRLSGMIIEAKKVNDRQDSQIERITVAQQVDHERGSLLEAGQTAIKELLGKMDSKLDRIEQRRFGSNDDDLHPPQ